MDLWNVTSLINPGSIAKEEFSSAAAHPIAAATSSAFCDGSSSSAPSSMPAIHAASMSCAEIMRRSGIVVRSAAPAGGGDIPIIVRTLSIPMHPSLEAAYLDLLRSIPRSAASALDVVQRLRQLCSSERSAKYAVTEAIVKKFRREHASIVVFVEYVGTLDRLVEDIQLRCGGAVFSYHGGQSTSMRARILDRFNITKHAVLVVSTAAGGVGVDFSHASCAVMFEPTWCVPPPLFDAVCNYACHMHACLQVIGALASGRRSLAAPGSELRHCL